MKLSSRAVLTVKTALLLMFGSGCAGAAASKPAVEFPTQNELAQLPSKKAPAEAFGKDDVRVEEWDFDAVPPGATEATYEDPSPWGTMLREIALPRKGMVSLSPSLRCAAEEVARFRLKNHGLPAESLRRFIVARCGSAAPNAVPLGWSMKVPAGMTDEAIAAHAGDAFRRAVGASLDKQGGHLAIGVAAVRDAGEIAVVAMIGQDEAYLEPASRSVDAHRTITVRGVVRKDASAIVGMINQGELGVASCESDLRVAPPKFAVTCRLADSDKFAWVEILAQERGHVLEDSVAELIAYEGDGSAVTYKARSFGAPAPIADSRAFTSTLVERLNQVRKAGKMIPLSFATKQSATNARLAGTLIAASLERDGSTTADRIALGMLAGWDIDGLIQNGRFFLGQVAGTRDVTAWLDFALERPIGRRVLLDPSVRRIAIGTAIPDDIAALGAAVTTYSLFESKDHRIEEERIYKRLVAVRAARGASAPRLVTFDELTEEADHVLAKDKAPMDALQDMLHAATARTRESVQGYVLEGSDLDSVTFPDALLRAADMRLALAVTHHRAPGAAWGQYVVFLIDLDPSSQPTATPTRSEAKTAYVSEVRF